MKHSSLALNPSSTASVVPFRTHRNLFILAAISLLAIGLRLQYLDQVTLDWDEDLYRAFAQDLLGGKLLYRDLWDHKPPGIYYLFAAIGWVHPSIVFFRAVSIAWGLASGLMLYAIASRLWSAQAGLAAFLAWVIVTAAPWGAQANAELFFTLFTLLAVYLFVTTLLAGEWGMGNAECGVGSAECGKENAQLAALHSALPTPHSALPRAPFLLAIGFFSGLAFQFKPVAAFDLGAMLLTVAQMRAARKRVVGWMLGGFLIPNLAVFACFARLKLVSEWLYATYWYNVLYITDPIREVLAYGPQNLLDVLKGNGFFFAAAAMGAGMLWRRETRLRRWFFMIWICLTFLSVSLGLKFLRHYFLQWLAPLCVLFGFFLHCLSENQLRLPRIIFRTLLAGWVGYVATVQGLDAVEKVKTWRREGLVYRDAAYRTAQFLRRNFPDKSVYVWRSPYLAIYFLSGQRPATRFLFWRHLTRPPVVGWIEKQWRADLVSHPPELIINSDSWNLPAGSVPFMNGLLGARYHPLRKLRAMTIYQLSGNRPGGAEQAGSQK
ncbi:MAG: glycosyltransferase family 39 protein [Acidobacteria bacterium]|nr:glycosyltransferase family 39 protein [Acidobacteriota bacterium]